MSKINHKNIIIYGIKEANKMINDYKIDLYKTEHWVYDKILLILTSITEF